MKDKLPKDHPRDVVLQVARDVVARYKGRAEVYFKFTCPHCGERCTFDKPNVLYQRGECFACGVESPIEEAGFLLLINNKIQEATEDVEESTNDNDKEGL